MLSYFRIEIQQILINFVSVRKFRYWPRVHIAELQRRKKSTKYAAGSSMNGVDPVNL